MAPVASKKWSPVVRLPVKDADLERLMERLDRIARDVELVADSIADRLGVTSDQDTEEYDEEDEDEVSLEPSER